MIYLKIGHFFFPQHVGHVVNEMETECVLRVDFLKMHVNIVSKII